jgi:hypothetical protein
MSHPYAQAALARERQNMLLADAEAARQARQARSQRRQRGRPAIRRSPLGWIPAWLASARGRLLTRRPESPSVASSSRGVLPDRSASAGGEVVRSCCIPGASSAPSMMAKGV